MTRRFGRRNFLIYGSAAVGTGLGLKACSSVKTANPSPASSSGQASTQGKIEGEVDQPVKVGLLHSLSGLMAISEIAVMDAEQFAIDQINSAGGVLGQPIKAVVEDGASDWPTFAEKAEKLITQDRVAALFGCWTAASRQAVLPVLEAHQQLLWYPLSQTDASCSGWVIQGGAASNQQLEPAVDWLLEHQGKQFFLLESQFDLPQPSIRELLSAQLATKGGELLGEATVLLNQTDFNEVLTDIQKVLPKGGIIVNRLNGDSNLDFFKQLKEAGLDPDQYPVMSVTIGEDEIRQIGPDYLVGHYAAWNYFQTLDTDANQTWVTEFKQAYGNTRVTSDPMASAYTLVYLWKQAVEQARSFESRAVRAAAYGQTFDSPGGQVTLQPNHYLSKAARIGQVREDGLFEIVWSSDQAIDPQPSTPSKTDDQTIVCPESDEQPGVPKPGETGTNESLSYWHRWPGRIG